MDKKEMQSIIEEVTADCKQFSRADRKQQLIAAGWVCDPSGDVWLPPIGTVPYRPYLNYSAWKQMNQNKKG